METTTSPSAANGLATKSHACVLCQQRKVKCDRISPCSACAKSRVECIYRDPAPPRRRKRRTPEDLLLARLKRYEELLKNAGVKVDRIEDDDLADAPNDSSEQNQVIYTPASTNSSSHRSSEVVPRPKPASERLDSDISESKVRFPGQLVLEEGRSRYFENNMWANLSDQVKSMPLPEEEVIDPPTQGAVANDNANDLFLGNPVKTDLSSFHPPPHLISTLWQSFLANINPLTHLIHAPTMQNTLSQACENMSQLSRGLEVFMFSMYLSTVHAMNDAECHDMLGESRDVLLMKYWYGTRQALINALWLRSSELMILQGYTLFLLSIRPFYDPRTLWILTGAAIRMGQRIGLHRDGSLLGVSAFETELRRRLWWQILVIDGRVAELAGSGFPVSGHAADTKLPLNVNDSDIYPSMLESPREHKGATEMIFCLLRYEFGTFFKRVMAQQAAPSTSFDGIWQSLTNDDISIKQRDRTIDELEEVIENKYLRFCDPLNRLHFLAATVGRTAITVMRFKVHLPRRSKDKEACTITQAEADMLFASSLKLIECDNLGLSAKSVQGFLWHVRSHFSWDGLIYLLSELRRRTTGSEVERGWQQLEECYGNHPEFLNTNFPLQAAIGTLAERAWDVRQAELARRQAVHPTLIPPPAFILALQSQKKKYGAIPETQQVAESYAGNGTGRDGAQNFDPNMANSDVYFPAGNVDLSPIDWAAWDGMIENFELHSGGAH